MKRVVCCSSSCLSLLNERRILERNGFHLNSILITCYLLENVLLGFDEMWCITTLSESFLFYLSSCGRLSHQISIFDMNISSCKLVILNRLVNNPLKQLQFQSDFRKLQTAWCSLFLSFCAMWELARLVSCLLFDLMMVSMVHTGGEKRWCRLSSIAKWLEKCHAQREQK